MPYRPELFVALPLLVSAIPIPGLTSPASNKYARDVGDCTHPGNPDFYGLGIRLGIYLQLFCTILGMIDSQSFSLLFDFHDSNAILLVAVFVALVKSTPSREIDTVDVVILLRLLWLIIICGFSLGHLVDEFRRMKRTRNLFEVVTVPSALLFRCIVIAIICIYNVWFWYRGVDFFQSTNPNDCPAYAFFFAKLSVDGGLQTFYKFTSTLLMVLPPGWVLAILSIYIALIWISIAYGIAFIIGLYSLLSPIFVVVWFVTALKKLIRPGVYYNSQLGRVKRWRDWAPLRRGTKRKIQIKLAWLFRFYFILFQKLSTAWAKVRQREPPEEKALRISEPSHPISRGYAFYLGAVLAYFVFAVVGIELTIYWNTVGNSYDIGATGQLVPFIIGMLSAVKVMSHVLNGTETRLYGRFRKFVTRGSMFTNTISDGQPRLKRSKSTPTLDRLPSDHDDDFRQLAGEILVKLNRRSSSLSREHLLVNKKTAHLSRAIPPTPSRSLLAAEDILQLSLRRRQSFSSILIEHNTRRTSPRMRKMISAWLKQDTSPMHHDFIAEKLIESFWGDVPAQDSFSLTFESLYDSFIRRYLGILGLDKESIWANVILNDVMNQATWNVKNQSKYSGRWWD